MSRPNRATAHLRFSRVVAPVLAGAMLLACQSPAPRLEVVPNLDLDRYAGVWYEIASFPQRFQEGCVATQAEYTLRDDGTVRVVNQCRDETFDGELRRIEGRAWAPNPAESEGKLLVEFFWPFRGKYWVIALDPEYRHAVVGHPSRDYLWILARERTLPRDTHDALLDRIEAAGFDLARLVPTPQPNAPVASRKQP